MLGEHGGARDRVPPGAPRDEGPRGRPQGGMARRSPMEGGPRGSQGRVTTGEPAGRRGTGNPGRGTTGYYPGWGAMGEPVTVETGSHGRGGPCRPAEKDFERAEKALLPRPRMIEQAPAICPAGQTADNGKGCSCMHVRINLHIAITHRTSYGPMHAHCR